MAQIPDDFVDSSSFTSAWYSADVHTAAAALPELAVDESVDLSKLVVATNKRFWDCGHVEALLGRRDRIFAGGRI